MKIFVVSWFYVPVTTSEALVTYKLLANSENEYVVCSAKSNKWSYKIDSKLESKNIKQYIFDTDDFDEFVEKSFDKYKELSATEKFDAIMTRSLPPESQLVGLKIKAINKDIPWIVSLGDPIANNPYETKPYCLENRHKLIRNIYINAPHFFLDKICPLIRRDPFKKLSFLNKLEKKVINMADIVISPTMTQCEYMMYDEKICNQKALAVPHSYDRSLYPTESSKKNDKFTFTFIGNSDDLRSVAPIVEAVKILKELNSDIIDKIKVRLIGNIPSKIKDATYVYFLQDIISIEKPCDYFESLKIMENSDCLIHVDAYFYTLKNGSIFFAAKIADYIGTGKRILGMTSSESPAGKIITNYGGKCCSLNPYDVAKNMISIVKSDAKINKNFAEKFNAKNVAKEFDKELERRLKNGK